MSAYLCFSRHFLPVGILTIDNIMRFKTEFFHFILDFANRQLSAVVFDNGFFRRQIHHCTGHCRNFEQGFLDPGRTGGAAHTGDVQFHFIQHQAKTKLFDLRGKLFQPDLRRVITDSRLFRGKID